MPTGNGMSTGSGTSEDEALQTPSYAQHEPKTGADISTTEPLQFQRFS